MTPTQETQLSLTDKVINRKQQLYIRYIVAILIDLTVMNLFNEYWPEYMHIASFTLSLFAAILLQILLQLTLKVEHMVATYFFEGKSGWKTNVLRGLTAWTLIFISKLIMLKAISIAFDGDISFGGPIHGVVAFIIIIATMIIAEQILLKIHNSLAQNN